MDFANAFDPTNLTFLLQGFLVTLKIAFFAILLSFVLGIVLGICRYTKLPVLSHLAALYIELIRNLPLLLVIFFGYFGLREWGIKLPVTMSVIVSMTLFTSALVAEIVRSGLNSVDRGLIEASRAQGFTYIQTLRFLVLPLGLKRTIPPMVSQFISLIKDTSLAVVISLPEMTHNAQIIYNKHFNATIPILLIVACLYFVVNYSLSLASRRLEKKLVG
ncbi:amino acid ABC transporter permease [Marininema halotolerans]|uniref:Putative glutamine transport system permease protein n=1 Tax=Marininema halotolerans TaxID=1155944 RepID=A0A1I6RL97_9BACL|nr:amino acid ABC transporter permease [Marininema halotolerans]SFS65462.1 putative glutamine transport system permease protein [Marininema halotolerans]